MLPITADGTADSHPALLPQPRPGSTAVTPPGRPGDQYPVPAAVRSTDPDQHQPPPKRLGEPHREHRGREQRKVPPPGYAEKN